MNQVAKVGGAAAVAALVVAAVATPSPAAAAAPEAAAPSSTASYRFAPARKFVTRYCGGCHTADGKDKEPQHKRGYQILQIDTHAQWQSSQKVIRGVLDKQHLDNRLMPPPKAKAQPSDAERARILEWLKRGSPNTPNGR